MCEKCRKKAEKALRQGTGFRVTSRRTANLEEILCQIEELEKKRALWWEKQLSLAGFPPGEYQFLPSEGVIVRYTLDDLAEELIEDLAEEFFEQWSNPHLRLV